MSAAGEARTGEQAGRARQAGKVHGIRYSPESARLQKKEAREIAPDGSRFAGMVSNCPHGRHIEF